MNRLTHAWIALRAIKLLKDTKAPDNLTNLLETHASTVLIGAYLPDMKDASRAGTTADNHVLKFEPFHGDAMRQRFTTNKRQLLNDLGTSRRMYAFIGEDATLTAEWWNAPYKGDVKRAGQHIPNRAMGFGMTMQDLLVLGDEGIHGAHDANNPFLLAFKDNSDALTKAQQAVLHFFILSHFVADACMPCHCDGRDLASFNGGLHHELEQQWSSWIRDAYQSVGVDIPEGADEYQFLIDPKQAIRIQDKLADADKQLGWFTNNTSMVSELGAGKDVWLEMMTICRASFAMASIMASPATYPYESTNKAPIETLFPNASTNDCLKQLTHIILHDAVLNVAIIWLHVWNHVMAVPANGGTHKVPAVAGSNPD